MKNPISKTIFNFKNEVIGFSDSNKYAITIAINRKTSIFTSLVMVLGFLLFPTAILPSTLQVARVDDARCTLATASSSSTSEADLVFIYSNCSDESIITAAAIDSNLSSSKLTDLYVTLASLPTSTNFLGKFKIFQNPNFNFNNFLFSGIPTIGLPMFDPPAPTGCGYANQIYKDRNTLHALAVAFHTYSTIQYISGTCHGTITNDPYTLPAHLALFDNSTNQTTLSELDANPSTPYASVLKIIKTFTTPQITTLLTSQTTIDATLSAIFDAGKGDAVNCLAIANRSNSQGVLTSIYNAFNTNNDIKNVIAAKA